ncbi:hybrid sensor histidine kinase/response regulator transcription factor [Spirosoma sp.]|uniref:hybrid sensor histidine kinase/response regulator transcription factor n=1 Tax=Spirosoma sp. TaxID=1899569 RepID=UPI003B3AB00C
MRILFLLFFLSTTLVAQQKGWQELTISDGLSQGMVFDLKQDRRGFLWIATKDGLNRYDGYNFKVFTHDPYNEYSLSESACSALLIDRKGRLWIGTLTNGLNLYDDQTQRFYHITLNDNKAASANNYEIRLLDEDPEGNIWVGTSVGISIKIQLPPSLQTGFPEKVDFTSQIKKQSLNLNKKRATQDHFHFSFNQNGECLTAVGNKIHIFNWRKPGAIRTFNPLAGETSGIFDLYEDTKQGFRFASASKQIKAWHRGITKSIALPGKTNLGAHIKPINKNTLAISTDSHLWLLSASQLFAQDSLSVRNAFIEFPPDVYGVTTVIQDMTGNIWAGTSGYGLRKFNPHVKQFKSYLPKSTLSNLLVDRQGRIYARYQFAFGLLDKVSNKLVPFLDDRLPEADRRQRNIIQDRQGFFWVSNTNFQTHTQHLFKFSSDWKLIRKYPMPTGIEFGFWVNQTLEDPAGYLWIGAMRGKLVRFNPKTETFSVFSYPAQYEMETHALLREPDGSFWIGTQQGLIKADHLSTKPTYTYFKNSTTNRQSLSNNFVLTLANDPDEPGRYLWVGTKGGGLDRLDKQSGQFDHFTEAQGLPNKVVYGILLDANRHLWLSTNRGLSQFNPRTRHFRNYTRADGLQDDEFNTASFTRAPSGDLLFGGVKGLNIVRPSELSAVVNKRPLVNIIGLKVNNKPAEVGQNDKVLEQSIEFTNQLNLSHDQNLLTFEFGVMDYTNSATNRYRYRLEGIDQDWVEAGTNRFANYAQLPDGAYQLAMMGSVDGEHWSKPLTLQIRINPPFYRTWWAYLFYLLVLVIIAWQLYRFQTQRLLLVQQIGFEQKEASRLAELDALKTRFFANISHEFRTPLTLILSPLTELRKRFLTETNVTITEPTVVLMEQNSNRLLSLITQLLDLSKLEAGQLKIESEPGDIAGFFQLLANSFTSLAETRGISFVFTQNREVVWANFDHNKFETIVINLLSNALKFTPDGQQVRMTVTYSPPTERSHLTLTVTDTGIGIASVNQAKIFDRYYQVDGTSNRNYEGTGIGLALVNELVRVLNGRIEVVSTEYVGTTFTVTLPLTSTVNSVLPSLTPPSSVVPQLDPFLQETLLVKDVTLVSTSDKILLIIDDNVDIRTYLRGIFEQEYQILDAVDGQDGLEKATTALPDLIICDLMMPRLDGFEFCRALKTQEATSHIPVVMLTAKATVEDRIEGFELGADDYLTKPFNQSVINARVRNLIEQRQRLFAHFSSKAAAPVVETPVVKTAQPSLLVAEQKFLERLRNVVIDHIEQPDFSVEALAESVSLSRVQLYRKLKAITNTTATDFIREIRLEKAAEQLRLGNDNVTQIAYSVGFESLSYFAKVFQERYQVPPSKYNRSIHSRTSTDQTK